MQTLHRKRFKMKVSKLPGAGLVAALLVLAACGSDTEVAVPATVASSNQLRQVLSPRAAASLDRNGNFVLPQHGDSATAEISGTQAKALAFAYWRDAAEWLEDGVSRDRGALVHAHDLQPCARAYYATSAYAVLEADAPLLIRKTLGPQWLVGLCYQGTEEVIFGVSAYATDAKLGSGRVHLIDPGVGNFTIMGVPLGAEIPMPPERVAQFVAQKTSERLADAPLLVMRPFPKGSVTALWKIDLESPVSVTSTVGNQHRKTQTLFAGALNGWVTPGMAADFGNSEVSQNAEVQEFYWAKPQRHTQYNVTLKRGIARNLGLVTIGGR